MKMKVKKLAFAKRHNSPGEEYFAHSHLGFTYTVTVPDSHDPFLVVSKGNWSHRMEANSLEGAFELADAHNSEMVMGLVEQPVKRPHTKRKPRNRQPIGLTERLSRIVPGHEEMICTSRDGYKALMRNIHSNSKRASLPNFETRILKAVTAKDDVVYIVGVRLGED